MNIPSNAFALFLCLATIATSLTKTNAFVVRPTIDGQRRTALGYIKEDYNTGIGPDILRKQRQKQTAPPADPIVENEIDVDGYIDAVVIEEDFHYDRTSTTEDEDKDQDGDGDGDGATQLYEEVVENMKREMSDTKPKDIFPDVVEDPTASSTFSIWDTNTAETIHGGSLRTWSMESPEVDYTQVMFKSTHWDNPLQAQIDVWNGPGHAPMKLAVYCAPTTSEQPLSFVIPTPGLNQQSIGVKNSGPLEFPMKAVVIGDVESAREQRKRQQNNPQPQGPTTLRDGGYAGFYESIDPTSGRGASREKVTSGLGLFAEKLRDLGELRKIEGIAPVQYATTDGKKGSNEELFEFDKNVDSVQVLIETSGLSCQARIEVTSDCDGEIQQVVELSVEDGKARPFFAVLDTSLRSSTSVRVINLDPYSAFPITACVEPYTIRCDQDSEEDEDNVQNDTHDFDFIDASIEDEEEMGVGTIIDGAVVNEKEEYPVYNVPDLTVSESLADYDFDEEFFFAS